MTAPQTATTADPQSIIAALQEKLDAALAREATLAEALATRNSEYGERIEQQAATIDVLKVMSASPGDPQPVFDLIVTRARDLCDGYGATVFEFDGTLIHWRAATGFSDDPTVRGAAQAMFPMAPTREWGVGRAILERRVIRIDDLETEPGLSPALRAGTAKSTVTIPLMRGDMIIGALSLSSRERGGFSDSQVTLLQTFAEQAVIAITSAETYRALQTRTSDLQESLEYLTATSEVLKVISRTTLDLQPVLTMVAETAARLCLADQAAIFRLKDDILHLAVNFGFPPEYKAYWDELGPAPLGKPMVTVLSRTIHERHSVHVHDVASVPGYPDQAIRLGKQRTSLGVRLLREGEPIGVILLARQRVEPFTDRQIELVSTFADQAVVAIENTRLITEQREALEQQTATAEVLQVINANPGDLAPVFDAMLEKAMRLCGAAFGSLYTYDGERFHSAAQRGVPPAYAAYRAQNPPTTTHGGPAGMIENRRPLHILDLKEQEPYRAGTPGSSAANSGVRAMVELGGIRTILTVPLIKDDAFLGVITIYRQEVRAFTDKQIALLENFAAQAVIAMENARLLTETRDALEQQTAAAEVLEVINSSPGDLRPVFNAMLENAMRLCGAAYGVLRSFDGERMRMLASRGVPAEYAGFLAQNADPVMPGTVPTPGTGLMRALQTAQPTQVLDARESVGYTSGSPGGRAIADLGGARTILHVPLVKDEVAVGLFTIYRQEERGFSDKQTALLENFAAQAVIAMENARLIMEQREALEQQTATAEVLGVINASPGNLAPVFDAMLEKAMRLCEAGFGSLYTYNGGRFQSVAQRGVSAAYAAYRERHPPELVGGAGLEKAIRTRRAAQVDDMMSERPYLDGNPNVRAMVDLGGMRTGVVVPLCKDDTVLGVISVFRQEVRPFSDRQVALLESFAAQAVIAMENARLLTEQREALEQQQAIADILQAINRSPGELQPVFDILLDKAMRLCEAAFGILAVKEGEQTHTVAAHGLPPALAEWRSNHPVINAQNTLLARVMAGEPYIHTLDLKDDDLYRRGEPLRRANVDLGGARTSLYVPLTRDRDVLGTIHIYRQEVRPFTDKQIAMLENFAAQAVVAMENARLLTEQREALERQTAIAEVLQVINASPGDLKPVFDAILEKAMRLCGAVIGGIYGYDGQWFNPVALRGVTPAFAAFSAEHPVPSGRNSAPTRILKTKRPAQVPDLADGTSYSLGMVELGGIRSLLDVPLLKEDALLGFIAIYREEAGTFPDKQIALLEDFAAQAVIAMENARLLSEVRQRQEELRITFENMGDGVAMFDEAQHLVAWNRKFQGILDVPDDIIARRQTFSEYVHYLAERGEYNPEADPEEHVRRLIEQAGQSRAYERTRPDGRVIEIRHNPVPGGGFVLIYADITERKRNEAEIRAARDAAEEASRTIEVAYRDLKAAQANLIQAEKMASLGQLTAGIAHEIKNPLNFVNNFAALSVDLLSELKETAAPGFAALTEKQRVEVEDVSAMLTSNLEKITEHGKRADGIVKAMLEHSRGSSAERRVVDLNALIDDALNLAYHGARAQDQRFNITLERDFGEGISPIEVNPQDITRVFLNLFSNGFYAATRRARNGGGTEFVPTLKVTTRDAGEVVEIRVRDNGTGIPGEIRDKLFQPFFTTKPTGEGTGLGLSITYDIVTKQHGGTIAVDSEVNEFTEFIVTLPRQMFANAPPSSTGTEHAASLAGTYSGVLIRRTEEPDTQSEPPA